MNSELPMVVPEQERSTKSSYRNKVISVVSVGLVVAGGALMVSASRGSTNDASISNLVAVDGHKSATAAVVPSWDAKMVVSSKDTKFTPVKEEKKGAEVKKGDDKKDVEIREEVDGGKPVSKKTAKPTVKPTTPPKPTVPPTTKKPSEKKDVQHEEAPKGKAPPARSLAEKGNPSPEANPSSGRQAVTHKSAAVPTEQKKGDEKKEEPREEVDGGKPVSKKTAKPTVKPTTPPKPTVPPTTKKPSEKKDIESEKMDGPKQHPAGRMLAEVKKAAAPAPKEVVVAKKDTMTPPKKAVAAKEEKKDVEPREEVDGGKPVAKKTAKPTVKPTTPPKPTVPPTTKKPAEKHAVQDAPKGKSDAMAPPKNDHRQLKEELSLSKALKDAEVKAYKEDKMSAKEAPSAKKVESPKKEEAPKEEKKVEKKDVESREEVDGGKPVSKKTAKPTVKPTTPPKPTVPPTTKKPAEKHAVQDRAPRQLKKSSSLESTISEAPAPVVEVAEDAPVIAEEDRHTATDARADGPKGMDHKKENNVKTGVAPPSSVSRMLTEKTASSVSQAAKNAIYGLSGPTKSPSTGLHKPTWKPTAGKPTGKPLETSSAASSSSSVGKQAVPRMLAEVRGKVTPSSSSTRGKGKTEKPNEKVPPAPHAEPKGPRALSAVPEPKDEKADPCHDGLSPRCTPPTSKPVEHRTLQDTAGVPTKSPSSGLHKPTWKPSSKPAEHAMEETLMTNANPALEPPSTIAPAPKSAMTSSKGSSATTSASAREAGPKGASKKLAHDGQPSRTLVANQATASTPLATHTATTAMTSTVEEAGVPTKSPSSGLHKPTWKPSSKPAEHAMEATVMTAVNPTLTSAATREAGPKGAAKTLAHDGVPSRTLVAGPKDEKADPCHDGLSPRCTPPTSKPVEHRSLAGSPTKSPSSGLHKPTWKPSSKPAEHRELVGGVFTQSNGGSNNAAKNGGASSGHAVVKMRSSANTPPSKSPSAGLHKPTWKPSSKPVENAMESTAMESSVTDTIAAAVSETTTSA